MTIITGLFQPDARGGGLDVAQGWLIPAEGLALVSAA